MEYYEVDENGEIIDVHLLEQDVDIPERCFLGWAGQILHRPKWSFEHSRWVEGMTPAEISGSLLPVIPNDKDRIASLERTVMMLMMKVNSGSLKL